MVHSAITQRDDLEDFVAKGDGILWNKVKSASCLNRLNTLLHVELLIDLRDMGFDRVG